MCKPKITTLLLIMSIIFICFFITFILKPAELEWKFKTEGFICDGTVIENGIVYFADTSGYCYGLAIKTGEKKWKFKIGEKQTIESISISNGDIYFGVETKFPEDIQIVVPGLSVSSIRNYFYAVDMKTKQIKWKFRSFSPNMFHTVRNGILYFVDNNIFTALDTKTGKKLWGLVIDPKYGKLFSMHFPPLIHNEVAYLISSNWGRCYAIDLKNRFRKWRTDTSFRMEASPNICDNILYIPCFTGVLYSINIKTGKTQWEFSVNKDRRSYLRVILQTPSIADEIIYFGTTGTNSTFYALNRINGKKIWEFKDQPPVGFYSISSIVLPQKDIVCVVGTGKRDYLYVLEAKTGKLKKKWNLGLKRGTRFFLSENDILYYGSMKTFFALRINL